MPPQFANYARFLVPAAVILALLYFFLLREPQPPTNLDAVISTETEQPAETDTKTAEQPMPTTVMIDVKGAVHRAGLYELPLGSRMNDAIEAAGGFLAEADSRSVNLAVVIMDESSIYVPLAGEETPAMQTAASGSGSPGLINLNTATEAELTELPGIGPAKAAAILAYRTENGPFQEVSELTEVSGIGEKSFEKLKDLVTVR